MALLKQATTYTRMFLMVLSSDHVSGATGKSVTVTLGKGGASGAAAGGTITEVDSVNLPGIYKIALTTADTNTAGDLIFHCTASGCDSTDFIDQVQSQIFTDLLIDANGRAKISNNLTQNTATNGFTFPMLNTSSQRQTGLTVTAQRTLGGGGFAPCTNSVTEITGTGIYTINLAAGDLNSSTVGLLFTATGAQDLYVPLIPTQ